MADPEETTLGAWWRKVRSRLPTSPLPKRWDTRVGRLAVAGAIVLVLGGALAAILAPGRGR